MDDPAIMFRITDFDTSSAAGSHLLSNIIRVRPDGSRWDGQMQIYCTAHVEESNRYILRVRTDWIPESQKFTTDGKSITGDSWQECTAVNVDNTPHPIWWWVPIILLVVAGGLVLTIIWIIYGNNLFSKEMYSGTFGVLAIFGLIKRRFWGDDEARGDDFFTSEDEVNYNSGGAINIKRLSQIERKLQVHNRGTSSTSSTALEGYFNSNSGEEQAANANGDSGRFFEDESSS